MSDFEMMKKQNNLQKLFTTCFVLGGSPCSGKSTLAERLAGEFDLHYYKVDDYQAEHLKRCDPVRHPIIAGFAKMDWNEIWMRPVELQVKEEFAFYRELSGLILEDLAAYDGSHPVLLEGAAFLPELVNQWGIPHTRAIFLIPTDAFQRHHYQQRGWIQDILSKCEDPKTAFDNWMARDHIFGLEIHEQAQQFQYPTIIIDGQKDINRVYQDIVGYFRPAK